MADPFSLATGLVGLVGVAIQVMQVVVGFIAQWKDAPKVHARAFSSENTSFGTLYKFGSEPGICKCLSKPEFNLGIPAWT